MEIIFFLYLGKLRYQNIIHMLATTYDFCNNVQRVFLRILERSVKFTETIQVLMIVHRITFC